MVVRRTGRPRHAAHHVLGEEADKFLALGGRSLSPVLPQRPLCRLGEVEDLVGNLVDRGPALVGPLVAPQLGVSEDLDDPIDPVAQLIRGQPCPRAVNRTDREQENEAQRDVLSFLRSWPEPDRGHHLYRANLPQANRRNRLSHGSEKE